MSEQLVLVDASDPAIAIITLNRPDKRNALSIELTGQLADAVESASRDPQRRVLVIRGSGPVFCAGLDLQEAGDESKSSQSARNLARVYLSLAGSPLITIASAQGGAFGGGAGLLAACDIAVAANDLRVGFPEVHRGLVAGLVTALLRRQMGDRDIRDLILLGRTIDSATTKSLGLVQQVVPVADLAESTLQLARQACDGAPGAIARTKRLLDDLSVRPLRTDIERALADHLSARNSAEAREGIAAFREHRKPIWPPNPDANPV
jgi:methylglutaconyl-CoA hydratase